MDKQTIEELVKDINQNANEKGWWDKERSFGDFISLCHSELSEALEEHRNGRCNSEIYYAGVKPEGIPIELADVIIRIFDFCGEHYIDIENAIKIKHDYNKTRGYRHGDKVI